MTNKYKPHETVEETLSLPKRDFIDRALAWLKEFNNGELLELKNPVKECPISLWVIHNNRKCNKELVPNTAVCPVCGAPVCPDCMNHNVDVISRVTGYLSTVSGWNESKQQEFKDRKRYNGDQ